MSSSAHIDNKKKDILVLGKGPTQGLEHTLTAEKMYSINFTVTRKKICLNLHYSGANSYFFVNGTEIIKFKAKDSEIAAMPLCLRNISKDWSADNMKKTGFNGYLYDFSVDYDATDVDDIVDIHEYLMKKNDTVFFTGLTILSSFINTIPLSTAPLNANKLSGISVNNQPCKARPEIVDVNSNNPIFYPFSVKAS